jgi:hypothetical protein
MLYICLQNSLEGDQGCALSFFVRIPRVSIVSTQLVDSSSLAQLLNWRLR